MYIFEDSHFNFFPYLLQLFVVGKLNSGCDFVIEDHDVLSNEWSVDMVLIEENSD